jgi:hypothetical protein
MKPSDIVHAMKNGRWYDDLRFPAASARVGATAPTWDTTNIGYIFDDNPGGANEQLQFVAQLPHQWRIGGYVDIHIHWILLEDDGAATEDVKWDALYRWYEIGATSNAGFTELSNTVDVSSQLQWIHTFTEIGEPTAPASPGVSSILEIKLERDTQDAADDHPHNVLLKELDLHYEIDSPGSLGEAAKWGP